MEQKIKEMIKEQLNTKDEIKNTDSLLDDLGMDSLDKIELIMYLEEEFLVEITDEFVEKIMTVQDIINTIKEKNNERKYF